MSTNFDDVVNFHRKFKVPISEEPRLLEDDELSFRVNFMDEELDEFYDAHSKGDLAGAFDALLDLVYVALGTAAWMGLPWQEGWDAVQRANMGKISAAEILAQLPEGTTYEDIGARHGYDVRKPEGWQPPDIDLVLERYRARLALRRARENTDQKLREGT